MARKVLLVSVILAMIVSLGFFTLKGFGKEQESEKTQNTRVVSEKIDEILKNQQAIIERLEDIKSELNIIKIRASRK
ncbi:MAG: hypothetical protein KJ957_06955 [Candidatus Omnitrophica bacterium]|nr:hypothetical protein [Candidatus Omnitrophota bacterium]MBU1853762.1 hypothetical protein [Candidatus Omnitrophota bacterium]